MKKLRDCVGMEADQSNQIPISGGNSDGGQRGNLSSSSSVSKRRRRRRREKAKKFTAIAERKVYAEFPEWSPDLIQLILDFVHSGQVTQRIKEVPVEKLRRLWGELVSKLEPPTFQDVLNYIKRWLESRGNEVLEPPKFTIPLCTTCGFLNIIKEMQEFVICFRCKRKLPIPEMAGTSEAHDPFFRLKGMKKKKKKGKGRGMVTAT